MRVIDRPILPIAIARWPRLPPLEPATRPSIATRCTTGRPRPTRCFTSMPANRRGGMATSTRSCRGRIRRRPSRNVAFYSLDTTGKEEFGQLPDSIKAAWKSRPAGAAALHVLVSPRGACCSPGGSTRRAWPRFSIRRCGRGSVSCSSKATRPSCWSSIVPIRSDPKGRTSGQRGGRPGQRGQDRRRVGRRCRGCRDSPAQVGRQRRRPASPRSIEDRQSQRVAKR